MSLLHRISWFLVLVALQVIVCNHVHIMGYATPLPYIYLLLIFHSETPRWKYIFWGFLAGLVVDLFSKCPGENAAVATFLALIVPKLRDIFAPADQDDEGFLPSLQTMKWWRFFSYTLIASFIYCLLFVIIESFAFIHLREMAINVGASTALTLLIILAIEKVKNSVKK